MKSRKSIKIGEKLKDLSHMNVPGPGVNSVLSSLTNLSNTTMSRGSMAVEDTQSENSQK